MLADSFTALRGWRRPALMVALGLLSGLAFAPFHLFPILLLTFPLLILMVQRTRSLLDAFTLGWCFAFGLLVMALHWIAGALFVEIKTFWWALPFAVCGLPAFFAINYGLATMLARRWGMVRGDGVIFFGLCWFAADVLRAHLFTGLPWDLLGYVWADFLPVLQSVSLIGIEGLTLLTVFLVISPSLFLMNVRRRTAACVTLSVVILFVALGFWGQFRLGMAQERFVPDVRLRLVQPDQDQALKWQSDQRIANLGRLLAASFNTPGEKPVTHIVWPETATSFYLTEEPLVRSEIAAHMTGKQVLLTGVVRRQAEQDKWRYYNSLIAMDAKGNVIAGYDKQHLVPFGEYMPFRSAIPFRVVTALGTDFTPGQGISTVRVPGLPPFSPLVCYEAIFSGEVAERTDPPHLLVNVTNDAWYKGTIGPIQHLSMSRVRAVEEGVPLVRVANMGITAIIDPWGRITAVYEGAGAGFVDADLPKALTSQNPFKLYGKIIPWSLALLLTIFLLAARIYVHKQAVK